MWQKLPTYFDDVTTIENNRQVRVNVDATLDAIFRIAMQNFVAITSSIVENMTLNIIRYFY